MRTENWPCLASSLDKNRHKIYYQSITEFEAIALMSSDDGTTDWTTQAERSLAIETDTLWIFSWNPITPVGSCEVWAASLAEIERFLGEAAT